MDQAAGTGDDKKLKNTIPIYGNKETMNLNTMILTNIQSSPYFKEDLYQYKTFHEVVDEIYYRVEHLEPWEKNSRKLAGQVGMCGGTGVALTVSEGYCHGRRFLSFGMFLTRLSTVWNFVVRGVAAGGIVSTAFCLLYKLFTLKLTRRQVNTMLNHSDSPYIRGLGIMYIRYCQPPADFWDWLEPYIDDEEEIDLKAGGGFQVTIGEMVRNVLTKLDWFGTLFPRVPLTVQKVLEEKIREARKAAGTPNVVETLPSEEDRNGEAPADEWGEAGRRAKEQQGVVTRRRSRSQERGQSRSPRRRSRGRNSQERRRDGSRERRRDDSRERRRDSSRERRRDSSRERRRDDSRERRRDDSRERRRDSSRERRRDDSRERRRERRRSRSRERARERRPRSRSKERRSHSRERRKRISRSRDRSKERRRSRDRSRSREKKGRRERSRSRDRPKR